MPGQAGFWRTVCGWRVKGATVVGCEDAGGLEKETEKSEGSRSVRCDDGDGNCRSPDQDKEGGEGRDQGRRRGNSCAIRKNFDAASHRARRSKRDGEGGSDRRVPGQEGHDEESEHELAIHVFPLENREFEEGSMGSCVQEGHHHDGYRERVEGVTMTDCV